MKALDAAYWRILTLGLIAVRDAAANNDVARCGAEAEHIHNIPSLIGEENIHRHVYYFTMERRAYLDWIAASGRDDLQQWASLSYSAAWKEMDEALTTAGVTGVHEMGTA
jgi:hypothetical protein